jgi:hypothetical protein
MDVLKHRSMFYLLRKFSQDDDDELQKSDVVAAASFLALGMLLVRCCNRL